MEIKIDDVLGTGKAMKKLIDVVAKGVGACAKPCLIRREADARAYEIETIAGALSAAGLQGARYDAGKIEMVAAETDSDSAPDLAISVRAVSRLAHQEAMRQLNLESVLQHAAEEVRDTPSEAVSDGKVDDDWISRFFNIAQDISSEHMQILWGKILAGEVTSPESYSLRTLEIVRNLTLREAKLFQKVAESRFEDTDDSCFLINPDNHKFLLDTLGIQFNDLLSLREAGLLVIDNLETQFQICQESKKSLFKHGPVVIWAEVPPGKKHGDIKIVGFTDSGCQLSRLIPVVPNDEHIKKLASLMKSDKIKVMRADIDQWTSWGQYSVRNQEEL